MFECFIYQEGNIQMKVQNEEIKRIKQFIRNFYSRSTIKCLQRKKVNNLTIDLPSNPPYVKDVIWKKAFKEILNEDV